MKIEWHQDLTKFDKFMRIFFCTFCSTILSILTIDMWFLFKETAPEYGFFNVILFFSFFYFFFTKIKVLPPPDKDVICPKSKTHMLSDINNPSNPYAYTTPGGIGSSEKRNSFDHARSRNSDFYNYYNR